MILLRLPTQQEETKSSDSGERFRLRRLQLSDYDKGFPAILSQLTRRESLARIVAVQ
jgi:hypothetical protein